MAALPSNECVLRVEDFVPDPAKKTQLTPTLPGDAHHFRAVVQAGSFKSTWIRLRRELDEATLGALIDGEVSKGAGAVYVCLPQQVVASAGHCLATVLGRDLKFYHFHAETDELVYYVWAKAGQSDMVPGYATSIEGAGVLVLSPDEQEVLLVFEYKRWGRCGGAVDTRESSLQAALREVREETQVEVDEAFPPRLALAINQPNARDGCINDHFMLFVARAKSKDLKLDHRELTDAHWFPIEETLREWRAYRAAERAGGSAGNCTPMAVPIAGKQMDTYALMGIERFVGGRTSPVEYVETGRPGYRALAF